MNSFSSYKADAFKWITIFDSAFYPDYLDEAKMLYQEPLNCFIELVNKAENSVDLLQMIIEEPNPLRNQVLKIFRRYVSPDTPVEMIKVKNKIPNIIKDFGDRFRDLEDVRKNLNGRPVPDEVLMALLIQPKDRGKKGYDLTEAFFLWFQKTFEKNYLIYGTERAGKDVMLNQFLPNWKNETPADILISRLDKTPLVVGFARYDSDRGGSQEDDRLGGNRDKVTDILKYSHDNALPLKVFFLNDGPGLLLGSMWNDYASLENHNNGRVMVCTLKMLQARFTEDWLNS